MERVVAHMNDHHKDELILLAKYITQKKDIIEAKLLEISKEGMVIGINNTNEQIVFPFDHNDDLSDIKNVIISKVNLVKNYFNMFSNIKEEINKYLNSFSSVVLATINEYGEPNATYSPIIKVDNNFYIYISEIAEHYHNLKNNGKLEVLFLQDESKAAAITARVRLRFKTEAIFINRNDDIFNKVLDAFEEKIGKTIKIIRKMEDFHLVKLNFLKGRYVKGFGQAYSVVFNNGDFIIEHMKAGAKGNIHKR